MWMRQREGGEGGRDRDGEIKADNGSEILRETHEIEREREAEKKYVERQRNPQ